MAFFPSGCSWMIMPMDDPFINLVPLIAWRGDLGSAEILSDAILDFCFQATDYK